MNPKKSAIIFILAALFVFNRSIAQPAPDEKSATSHQQAPEGTKMNFVKLNLPALALSNFSLQYERIISKQFSAALGIRFMPNTGLPFKNTFETVAGADNPDAVKTINGLKVSNFAITPEFRFYVGKKGYGRGFYIAPYYRYASFKSNALPLDYTNASNQTNTLTLKGDIKTHSGGILFGAQWLLGTAVTLDWWIMGAHYGTNKGTFTGNASIPLTAEEQADLKTTIDDFNLPVGTKTSVVNANGASIQLSGPWAGVRGGLALGIRF